MTDFANFLTFAPDATALKRVLIIEETSLTNVSNTGQRVVPRLFLKRLASYGGNSLIPLDESINSHVTKLHVVYPSVCQFYCAEHLECNPHYTVGDGDELSSLVRSAISKGIVVKYYEGDKDHTETECVRVLNNVHLRNDPNKIATIPWDQVFHEMQSPKYYDFRRGSYTSHVGFSSTRGQGWHNPYPELDDYADGALGLCKPGITSSMHQALLTIMGQTLALCGALSKRCWGETSVNPNIHRQNEFSDIFRRYLGCASDVVFEAGTFALLQGEQQNLAVHTDVLNDSSAGYDKTGVLSLCLINTTGNQLRMTAIGYNRRCCNDFMLRKVAAIENKQKALSIYGLLHTLTARKQRNLRIIECAACLWLSTDSAFSVMSQTLYQQYTSQELTEARMVIQSVMGRGMNATQESRPQISSVKRLVMHLYQSKSDLLTDVDCICRALTYVIYAHAKNHKLDGVSLVNGISGREEFKRTFGSYGDVMKLYSAPAQQTTWVDVYGEYTFNKLYSTLNPMICDERLQRFSADIAASNVVQPEEFVKKLLRHKVFILGGRLFQILTVVLFKELGLVSNDACFQAYLPRHFTKTSGSVKLLRCHAGMPDPITCREYIRKFSEHIGISAVTYENILCKFHVAHYGTRGNKM